MGNKKGAVIVVSVALLIGAGSAATIGWKHHEQQNNIKQVQTTHVLSYQGENGQTALALLQKHAHVTVKNTSYGPFVETIDGVSGGTSGKYWMFYINNKEATVGAGAYKTKNGDTITWKFQ